MSAKAKLAPIREPLSVGLLHCPRCNSPLYEMPGDLEWCRYFECRNCVSAYHLPSVTKPKHPRRFASLNPRRPRPSPSLVLGKRRRNEVQEAHK